MPESAPLIFTGLVTPHDPVSGEVNVSSEQVDGAAQAARYGSPMLDIPFDHALAQAWTAFRNLAAHLAGNNVGLDRLARLRILLRDLRDLPVVQSVAEHFLDGAQPALSIVQVPTVGVDPAIAVVLDAVAVAHSAPPPEPLAPIHPDGPHGVRAGDLVFIGATVGRDATTGEFPRSIAEASGAPQELSQNAATSTHEEEIAAQSWVIFRAMAELLEANGGSLADVVKLGGWLTFPMREYMPLAHVRQYCATAHKLRPASGAIQVQAIQPEGGKLAFDAVAITPGSERLSGRTSEMSEIYTDAELAGGYVWTSGEVSVDPSANQVVTAVKDLEGNDRQLAAGTLHRPTRAEIQARAVYRKLCVHLAQLGPRPEQVVHQTVFIRTPDDYLGVERAALAYLGPVLPPTTVVPVCDASPSQKIDVEIELVARSDGGSSQ